MTVGHIHGRFQPFHREHLEYAVWAAEHCDRLLIGITNADPSHVTEEDADPERHQRRHNPFQYHERYQMIRAAVDDSSIDVPVWIVPFPINRPELWAHYVPDEAVHFLNVLEEWHTVKAERLEDHGRTVKTKRGTRTISGTNIRKRMASGERWEQNVPNPVVSVIHEINGVQRVQKLWDEGGQ